MNEEFEHNIPADADDLSKHAPALFAMKSKGEGLVVPDNYFEELTEIVMAKTVLPEDGGLVVPEEYFNELPDLILAKTTLPTESGLTVPENYFEDFGAQLESQISLEEILPKQSSDIPAGYFEVMENELHVHIALDNIKQEEGFVVPEGYFTNLTERILAETVLDKDNINNDEVPEGYFESLHGKVADRIAGEEQSAPETGRVLVFSAYIKQYARPMAIAASAALLIGLGWFAITSTEEPINTNTVAQNDTLPQMMKSALPIVGDTLYREQIQTGIALETPKNPERIKPNVIREVIMQEDEIIAQSDLLDESMVMDFVAENEVVNASEEVLDESMMEYLMNDNATLDVIDPGNK